GSAEVAAALPVGEVIERAAAQLALAPTGATAVRLDAVTAGLLDARFDVRSDAAGAALWGERPGGLDGARTLLGRATAVVGRDDAAQTARQDTFRARIGRNLGGDRARAARVTEFLGELAGVPFPDEHSVQLREARQSAALMGDQMRRAWEDWLAAECDAAPVL